MGKFRKEDAIDFSWVYDHSDVDWDELSELYRIAPLGKKSPQDLKTAFSNSRFKCFVYSGDALIGVGRALADGVDCSYLCDVAVHPEYQGLRLGKKIMEELIALSEGHKKLFCTRTPGRKASIAGWAFAK